MLLVGLTGSIGMGKTAIAARLRALGIPVCDADAEVHRLYEGAAVAPIEAAFPGTTADGRVDRQKLAAVLMADPHGFQRLEAIVHPLVQAAERDFLQRAAAGGAEIVVLEIPLLFETGGDRRVDVVVVASAPPEVQRRRVLGRENMSDEKLEHVLVRQWSDEKKRAQADFVVDTSGTFAETHAQVDRIVQSLRGRTGSAFATHWT
jgi:dephospho-CoA kinase